MNTQQSKIEIGQDKLNTTLYQSRGCTPFFLLLPATPCASGDLADRAQFQIDVFNQMALLKINQEIDHQKLQAQKQLAKGQSGCCESCGVLIPEARMQANKWATRCIECQKAYERKRK